MSRSLFAKISSLGFTLYPAVQQGVCEPRGSMTSGWPSTLVKGPVLPGLPQVIPPLVIALGDGYAGKPVWALDNPVEKPGAGGRNPPRNGQGRAANSGPSLRPTSTYR
jgi:hypothetical protein